MPSVMQTTRGISASMASWIPPAARGGLFQLVSGRIVSRSVLLPECDSLRDEDPRGSCASLLDGIGHVLENGKVKMCAASLLGVCATDDLCACEHSLISLLLSRAVLSAARKRSSVSIYRMRWPAQRGTCCRKYGLACETLPRIFHASLGCCQEVCKTCNEGTTTRWESQLTFPACQ